MKTFIISVYIISLINLSFGVVINGTITNSTLNNPIDSAMILFRIGMNPDKYPTIYSDSKGYFQIELTTPPDYLLQIVIKKDGFVSKKLQNKVTRDFIELGNITIDELTEDTILFQGTVIDSITLNPIAGVKINLTMWKAYALHPYMEIYTDNSGSFNQSVLLSNDSKLSYTIVQSGYYQYSSSITSKMDSIHQKILLSPEGSIQTEVTGKVIDSITRQPVSNALVLLWTNYSKTSTMNNPDTSYTNSHGIFTRSIERVITIGSSEIPTVRCIVNHNRYNTKFIRKRLGIVPSKIDLGEIVILHNNNLRETFTTPQTKIKLSGSPLRFTAFSLSGRTISKDIINQKQLDAASQIYLLVEDKDKAYFTSTTFFR